MTIISIRLFLAASMLAVAGAAWVLLTRSNSQPDPLAVYAVEANTACSVDSDCMAFPEQCSQWGWLAINKSRLPEINKAFEDAIIICSYPLTKRPIVACKGQKCRIQTDNAGCAIRFEDGSCALRCDDESDDAICR